MSTSKDTTENYELLFLIVKFLKDGFCPEAASLLQKELVDPNRSLLPPRIDWEGNPHPQTFSDLERQFPHVSAQHITALTSWLRAIPRTVSVPGPRSLLSLPGVRPGPARLLTPLNLINNQQFGLSRKHPNTKISMYSNVYQRLLLQRRSLGHLSSVFCLLFDKSGHYIFTGADDLLVKMWGTYNGRLYFTFRGASAEISDMAVSEDNKLLAAGSTDKIIRVWCLISAAPMAVLSKHTGTITALHFCPCVVPGIQPYLAATSGDGTVSFWKYQYKDKAKKRAIFDPEPTRYHEKMRPGGAQMICAAFSPGGLFLATGSADHHVRVYMMMDGKEGPGKVLEQEAHTERVDSIQWANNPVLRFISGSKDGTARIWGFRNGSWNSSVLKITSADGRTVHFNKEKKVEEPLRVTMVNWNCDDSRVITAVSDSSLCIWCPYTSALLQRLQGHKDEVYVLEPHPMLPTILMSGAHDGNLMIWDMEMNKVLFKHHNNIDGQGHGAIYDAKWCPDNLNIAASDSHGHILFFSANSDEGRGLCYNKCPEEMFFHTDYRPLLRDSAHHVVDEQTQCAPHLLPPPFLVDVEGNPYPADIQRLVPGREHLSDREALIPNDEPSPMSPLPVVPAPMVPRPPSVARRSVDTADPSRDQPASNIDVLIAQLAANVERSDSRTGSRPSTDSRAEAAVPAQIPDGSPNPNLHSEHSYAVGGAGQGENGGRPSIVMPAPASQQLFGSVWRRRNLVKPEQFKTPTLDLVRRKAHGIEEKKFFRSESKKVRHSSGHAGATNGHHEGLERLTNATRGKGGRAKGGGRTRAAVAATATRPASGGAEVAAEQSSDDDADHDFNHSSVTDSSLSESDLEAPSGTSSDSTEYSDWGANNLTPPQRTARKSGKAATTSQPASSEEDEAKPGPSRYFKRKKYNFDPTHLEEIPPEYLPSPWLAEYIPKKTPYFPQMGDEVMYFKQGHMGYINLVKHRNCYKLNMREQQWRKRDDLKEVERVKVVGMKYDIRPPRLCCLKLAVMSQEDDQLSGHNFSIKYHDMNDVVDFLVLRHIYESAMTVKWNAGDRYRCQIEDGWWYGSVLGVNPFDTNIPDSPFLSILCLWDSGEEERLSPWDLDEIPDDGLGMEKVEDQVPVTKKEIERHLYQPLAEEWRGLESKSECERISKGLEQVMALAHAENFNYPVDLTLFPDYMLEIEYPMDFSLIKSRLDNQFYRRSTAVQFDVRYIATNTECYNRPKTDIVKDARILTDLALRVIQDPKLGNITKEYHRLVEHFKWEDTQEAIKKPTKESRKSTENKDSPNPKQWKHDCNELLNIISQREDSQPFREPVDEDEFPDYNRLITTPMDLTLVRESLRVGEYENPLDFQKDVMLMFSNSFQYNTNKKSEVLKMTKGLKAFFLDEFQGVISNWRRVNRRIGFLKKKGTSKSPKNTPIKRTPSKRKRKPRKKEEQYETEGTDDDSDQSPKKKTGKRKLSMDESYSEEETPKYKGKGKGKGKGKSSQQAKRSRQEPVREEEEDNSESDDDVPISKRREKPKASPQKKSIIKGKKKSPLDSDDESLEESEEEAIEETPDESSEVDEDQPGFKEDKMFLKNKKKRRRSTSESDPAEGNSKGARPKRSAKARVIKDDTDSEPEHEAKVPYRRKVTPKAAEVASGSGRQRIKSSDNSGSRPRRQATEKALNKFESGFSSEDESLSRSKAPSTSPKKSMKRSSESTDPRPRRQGSGRSSFKHQDETDSDEEVVIKNSSSRKKKPILPPSETVSEDSAPEHPLPVARKSRPPPPTSPVHHNLVSSSHGVQTDQPGPSGAGVTISAADSSTDYRSAKRNARTASKFPSSITTEPNSPEDPSLGAISEPGLSEGGSSSRRPQRKIVKPIRLQDYSDDEEMREAKRKNGVPIDEPKPEKSKKPKKKKKRSLKEENLRPERSDRYRNESDSEDDSESELLSHRLKKSRKSSGSKGQSRHRDRERKISAADYMLSPKAKRSQSNVNYRDESDSHSEPLQPQSKKSSKVSTASKEDKREKRQVDYKDETGSESELHRNGSTSKKSPKKSKFKSGSRKDHSGSRERRQKDPVKYEEYSYESGDVEDEEVDTMKELKAKAVFNRSDSSGDSESGLTIKYDTGERESEEDEEGNHQKSEHEDRVNDLLANLEALADSEEQEDDSEEDLGKRRGSRKRKMVANANNSVRPQRSAGQSARHNFREESTDDDLPPKRHHRPKSGPSGALGRGRGLLTRGGGHSSGVSARARPPSDMTESSDDDDEENYDEADAPGGSGVSSRGRVRRPNPKLMD